MRSNVSVGMLTRNRSQTAINNQPSVLTIGKRNLSPEPISDSPNSSVSAKKSKKAKMSTQEFEALKSLITASSNAIETKIDDSQKVLEHKFTDFASKVNEDMSSIKSSVNNFQSKINVDMDEIKLQLSNHAQRMDVTEDDVQRIHLSNDLRLTGFAAIENENLLELFNKISVAIDFVTDTGSNLPILERLPIKNKTTGEIMQSRTVLIHFAQRRNKQIFYSCYLNKMPLDPTKFGLPEGKRIVIGENLTKRNAQIFQRAQMLKKESKIAQTFTEDGIVIIRLKRGKREPSYKIRTITQLETIVAQHETSPNNITPTSNDTTSTTSTTTANTQHTAHVTVEHAFNAPIGKIGENETADMDITPNENT